MDSQGLNANSLSVKIGTSDTVIRSILNGRNKPGFDTLEKIIQTFDGVDVTWLLTGKGEMYIEKKKNSESVPDNKNATTTQEYLDKCLECKKKDETIERLIKMLEQLNEKILKYERELELISENQPKSKLSSG